MQTITKLSILLAHLAVGCESVRVPGRTVIATSDATEEGARARRLLSDLRRLVPPTDPQGNGQGRGLNVPMSREDKLKIIEQDRNSDPLLVGVSKKMTGLVGKANAAKHGGMRGGNARYVCD